MIVELENDESIIFDKDSDNSTNQSILLPDPATNQECYQVASSCRMGHGRTLSMKPEE